MSKLTSNVFVDGTWYGPSYPDAGDPPEGSVDQRAYEGDEMPSVVDPPETVGTDPSSGRRSAETEQGPPPKTGPGSSRATWLRYADVHGVRLRDDTPKDDIIAACETAGVRTG